MEKVFSWPVLVTICGIFIAVWIALQAVSTMRLEAEAQMLGAKIFSWNWPGENWQSRAEITETSIIRKGDNDAVIRIKGKQHVSLVDEKSGGKALDIKEQSSETVDCTAVLTLYKMSGKWVLGRVEL